MSERILVDNELFLGRLDEQQRFRALLDEILNACHRSILKKRSSTATEWAHVVLLYGPGGIGKTTLSKRLRDIASGLSPDRHYHHKFKIIWLDWEVLRRYDRRLTARDSVTFETILDHLYSAFCKEGFMNEFDHFNQKRSQLGNIETSVDRMLNTHTEDSEDLSTSLAKLGSVGVTNLIRERLPEVDAFIPQEEMTQVLDDIFKTGTEGLGHLRGQVSEWLHHHLKTDEYDLFTFPQQNLARAFAQGVRAVTRSRPLIIFLDTYEIVDKSDQWLRLIISQSGPRVLWTLSGRDNLAESRYYGQSYFIGYQGEVPAQRLRTFPMREFSQDDIITYFAEKVPARPLTSEQATTIHQATYGIPLAVKAVAALWIRGASLEAIIEGLPERTDREMIVRTMIDRLLVHARSDLKHPQDVSRLYALALVYQPDYDLLAALWEGEDVRQVLDDMERRYEFVFAYKMGLHYVVRDFLREYLLADVERRSPAIQSMNKQAILFLERRLADSHSHLKTLEARLEDDHWIDTVLALIWHRLWLNEEVGWNTFQITLLAALAYNRELVRVLLNVTTFFYTTRTKTWKRRLETLNPILKAEIDADPILLNILEQALTDEDLQPDHGCTTEFAAIVAWSRSRIARQQGLLGEALNLLEGAARQVTDKMRSLRVKLSSELNLLGDKFWYNQKRYEEAIIALNQAIKLNPKSGRSWHSLGHIYRDQHRLEESIGAFEQSSILDPKRPDNWLCLGDLYKEQRQVDKAVNAYHCAIERSDDKKRQAIVWYRLGNLYYQQKKMEQAIQALKKATDLDPQAGEPWFRLGYIYFKEQGQLEEAINAFQEASKNSSDNMRKFNCLCYLGDIYFLQDRLKEATIAYNEAEIINPNYNHIWHNMGHIYEKQNQLMEAVTAFQQAIFLDPDRPDNLSCLGEIYIKQGQVDKAIDAFLKSIDKQTDVTIQASLWHQVSKLYHKKGKFDEALNSSQQATALNPTKAIHWLHLGDLLRKQNYREEAINAYRKGIELIPQEEIAGEDRIVEIRNFLEAGSE